MSLEVFIDGDRSLAAQVLECPIDYEGKRSDIRDYLYNLLKKLWKESESFSGKRPFGNSGWEYDVYVALAKAKIIDARLDEDGLLEDITKAERVKADDLIFQAIAYAFYGASK